MQYNIFIYIYVFISNPHLSWTSSYQMANEKFFDNHTSVGKLFIKGTKHKRNTTSPLQLSTAHTTDHFGELNIHQSWWWNSLRTMAGCMTTESNHLHTETTDAHYESAKVQNGQHQPSLRKLASCTNDNWKNLLENIVQKYWSKGVQLFYS